MPRETVDRETWLAASKELLKREKALTRERDLLAEARRALPRVRVEADYGFEGPEGALSMADLFAGRSQLAVYHFMFAPDWEAGCPICSFWADSLNGLAPHLAARDVSLTAAVPEGMLPDPIGTSGPPEVEYFISEQSVQFKPLAEIPPGKTVTYRVRVRAVAAGKQTFQVELMSPSLAAPVRAEEVTEVFE